MGWKGLPAVLALAAAVAAAIPAAAQGAGPRDIREVFLAVPVPESGWVDEVFLLDRRLATRAGRVAALESALAAGAPNVLDARNGYLRLRLPSDYQDDVPPADSVELVMTYFTQPGGRRLVVMQVGQMDERNGETRSDDYFWTLEGGRFTPRPTFEVLPEFTYRDFWGDAPVPEDFGEHFFYDWDALHVEWPRQGTTARLRLFTPAFASDLDPDWVARITELFESRRFGGMALHWDRARGVFTRGERTPYTRRTSAGRP